MAIELQPRCTGLFVQLVGHGKSSSLVVFGPQSITQPKPFGLGCAVLYYVILSDVISHAKSHLLLIKSILFLF